MTLVVVGDCCNVDLVRLDDAWWLLTRIGFALAPCGWPLNLVCCLCMLIMQWLLESGLKWEMGNERKW